MNTFVVRCKCGQEMKVPRDALGKTGKCVSCGKAIKITRRKAGPPQIQLETVDKREQESLPPDAEPESKTVRRDVTAVRSRAAKGGFSREGKAIIAATLVIFVVLGWGYLRLYYGGAVGMRLVAKHSFSFKDTIVNLDDLLGQPRIVVATQHPAVKRQLEEMGFIETDNDVQERVRREIDLESKRIMREVEEEAKQFTDEMLREMRRIEREWDY